MKNIKIISNSQEETKKIASMFAQSLKNGQVIVLTGDLGSGKTKFVEGLLEYFGLQDEISSSTFNIINEYHTGEMNIYHFDVYRLEDADEFYAIGGEEYFEKGICLIEWGEMIKEVLPENYIQITISKDERDEDKRVLEFSTYGTSEFKEEQN